MVAGRWRECAHSALGADLEDVRRRLLESGKRLLRTLGAPGGAGVVSRR
ncbi:MULTISPECIES: hypothetical protein [Streptomyces]|uniref:Uncharacterized protein n=1 Tax=Streptomyces galilaeus TaxID=33899 RepID=A0ABW9IQ05_STRGJ